MARVRLRRVAGAVATVLAVSLVWFTLGAPSEMPDLIPSTFLRIPLEGLLLAALVLVLPARTKGPVALAAGTVLGLPAIIKFIDLGFSAALR